MLMLMSNNLFSWAASSVPESMSPTQAPESDTTLLLTPPAPTVGSEAPTATTGSRPVLTPSAATPSYCLSPSFLLLVLGAFVWATILACCLSRLYACFILDIVDKYSFKGMTIIWAPSDHWEPHRMIIYFMGQCILRKNACISGNLDLIIILQKTCLNFSLIGVWCLTWEYKTEVAENFYRVEWLSETIWTVSIGSNSPLLCAAHYRHVSDAKLDI